MRTFKMSERLCAAQLSTSWRVHDVGRLAVHLPRRTQLMMGWPFRVLITIGLAIAAAILIGSMTPPRSSPRSLTIAWQDILECRFVFQNSLMFVGVIRYPPDRHDETWR